MLYCYARDRWSLANNVHKRTTDGSGANWRIRRSDPWWFKARADDYSRYTGKLASAPRAQGIPKGQSRRVCLGSRGHARDRPLNHGSQIECITLIFPNPTEETSICTEVGQSHPRGSTKIAWSKFHLRSVLPRLVGKCCHGKKGQWKTEDVRGLHGPQ